MKQTEFKHHFPVAFKKCSCGKDFETYAKMLEHIDNYKPKPDQGDLFEKAKI